VVSNIQRGLQLFSHLLAPLLGPGIA